MFKSLALAVLGPVLLLLASAPFHPVRAEIRWGVGPGQTSYWNPYYYPYFYGYNHAWPYYYGYNYQYPYSGFWGFGRNWPKWKERHGQ
jgi:hypothetical protein